MNVFVGNLAFEAKEADVYQLFMSFGKITNIAIVMDKKGTKSRGFGFLEMPDEEEAKSAIAALHRKELLGRSINVEPAVSKGSKEAVNKSQRPVSRDQELRVASWSKPGFRKKPGYKRGRRTRSFMRKRIAAGITEPMPERKIKENPLRWRKKKQVHRKVRV